MPYRDRSAAGRRARRPRLAGAPAAALLIAAGLAAPAPAGPAGGAGESAAAAAAEFRRAERGFGGSTAVAVRGMQTVAARTAVTAAYEEIHEVERLAGLAAGDRPPPAGGVAALVPGAASRVDPRLARLFERARSFCLWSGNAHGPLGGRLYALWRPDEDGGRPTPAALAAAIESARCTGLAVDPAAATVELPEGSAVDLTGFAAGFAADRAADALRAAGATNGVVEVGTVVLAFGPGPEGRGWPVELPAFPGTDGPLDRLLLRDQAVAVAAAAARPLTIAGDRHAGYLDQRTGRPAQGVVAAVAVAELAIDAEALAATSLILGSREGTYLVGQLRPTPAVLWLLGSGTGHPLLTSHHWSQVRKD